MSLLKDDTISKNIITSENLMQYERQFTVHIMNFKVVCTHYVCLYYFDDNLSSITSKYVVTMYRPVNAMYGICT